MNRTLIISLSVLASTPARAEPISAIIAAVTWIGTAISSGVTAFGVSVFGATAWGAISGFLASPFGSLLLGVGLSLVSTLFVSKQKKAQNAPSTEAGKINVRITEPERWLCAGRVRQGGGVVFGEFDSEGYFWSVIVHSDSPRSDIQTYFLDDLEVTLSSGFVVTPEFCLDNEMNLASSDDTLYSFFTLYPTTFTNSNPVSPAIEALKLAFPGSWTDDHKLAGATYTVLRISPLPIEDRHKIWRWRGPFGMGDPAVSIVADWSFMYDPRDGTQNINVPSTWKTSRNPAIIWAWFRTHRYGRGKSMSSINWTRVAEQANICDQIVIGSYGSQRRYECGIAIPESKDRATAEQEILLTCDGQLVFDDDGKCWARVGHYEEPELRLVRNRDIVGMESVEAQSGESESQGVIVRYIDPNVKYSVQPAAVWKNPLYYVEGQTPKYLMIDVLGCQNHNQAMRLAKAFGYRSQPPHKILPTVGLRGLKARQERIVDIQYDNTFAGQYEIVTPVEVDPVGVLCGFGAVPIDANRWTLLPGEEQSQSVLAQVDTSYSLPLPTGVALNFNNNRIEGVFDAPPRADIRYRFQYKLGSSQWTDMIVSMLERFTYSGTVFLNSDYDVRWQTVSASGRASEWSTPVSVNTSPLTLSGTPVTTATKDVAYAGFTFSASGGVAPYTYSDPGNKLPPGITINASTGAVTGTPTVAGTYSSIVLRAVDSVGNFRNRAAFTITVTP